MTTHAQRGKSGRVKVTLSVSIELDGLGWSDDYGLNATDDAVKADVRRYVQTALQDLPGLVSNKGTVTVKLVGRTQ